VSNRAAAQELRCWRCNCYGGSLIAALHFPRRAVDGGVKVATGQRAGTNFGKVFSRCHRPEPSHCLPRAAPESLRYRSHVNPSDMGDCNVGPDSQRRILRWIAGSFPGSHCEKFRRAGQNRGVSLNPGAIGRSTGFLPSSPATPFRQTNCRRRSQILLTTARLIGPQQMISLSGSYPYFAQQSLPCRCSWGPVPAVEGKPVQTDTAPVKR